jgi:spermidine synthase
MITKRTYAGVFLISSSLLMFEILTTRIFSVTLWYHFAFMAISIALFGLTAGAVLVYLAPRLFPADRTHARMALFALLFAAAMIGAIVLHLRMPQPALDSWRGVGRLSTTYILIALPFVFGGVCVCLALTRFPERISRLYAADLAGAAAGCVVVLGALTLTDGPTAVTLVAAVAAGAAILFAAEAGSRGLKTIAASVAIAGAVFAAANVVFSARHMPLLRPAWVKGAREAEPLYEKWNSFSRILIFRSKDLDKPFGWGFSPTFESRRAAKQLGLTIDGSAFTVLTGAPNKPADLDYLKYDVTNIAHVVRPGGRVLVIGAGGGRDVLSALAFGQSEVTAVEINRAILRAVNGVFGRFTGNLDRDPRVKFVHDEARSHIARSRESFDIIQSSLIDTWAATAAGAFALSENSLYTVEAWTLFLARLRPRGVIAFSRWFREMPSASMYRLAVLARTALDAFGAAAPRRHLLIVRNADVGTLLVSRDPFSDEDVRTFKEEAARLGFEVVLTPGEAADPKFAEIADTSDVGRLARIYPFDISAPNDNRPFFFQTTRLRDAFRHPFRLTTGPVPVLVLLLFVVAALTLVFILGPLALSLRRVSLRGSGRHFLYFSAIGLGFMFVEIAQIQRLTVFLGHPSYSLSVVLFAMLLASGAGSFLTRKIPSPPPRRVAALRWGLLLIAVTVCGGATPAVARVFSGAVTPVRVVVAAALVAPAGLFMGMAFPLGMKAVSVRHAPLTSWMWGLNGAASVLASVGAVIVAIGAGLAATFWTGAACYLVAAAFLLRGVRS